MNSYKKYIFNIKNKPTVNTIKKIGHYINNIWNIKTHHY